jgi:hypothetical protein
MAANNKFPWDLQQRGRLDSARHQQKIKEAIKKNLHHIIAEEAIITSDGNRKTKIPVRYLDSYHFKHGYPRDGVGHGPGKPGDILRQGKKKGDDKKAGDSPGMDVYDAEIEVDELTDMMIEDLGLPWLENKDKKEVITKETVFTDLRKKGIMSNWAKRATVMENIKRKAREGKPPKFGDLKDDDMRFRTWDEKVERHSNAVIYLMMDRSGSMDDHKRYLCKATFWWLCRFLERLYDNVEVIFIAHDSEAKVVEEKDFFSISNDGGTVCSSAYSLAWEDIRQSRPPSVWNVYCFHFSDGDNMSNDNEKCVKLVKEMLARVNMFAYGEVSWNNAEWTPGISGLRSVLNEVKHPRLMTALLREKSDVYPTLQKFLNNEIGEPASPDAGFPKEES